MLLIVYRNFMMKLVWRGALVSTLIAISSAAAAQSKQEVIEPSAKQMAELQRLTPEAVAAAISITDDSLEVMATLNTSKAYSTKGKFTDPVRSDNFLRAMIDKKTGATTFQVYQMVRYTGDTRMFTSVNYATGEGPINAPVQTISNEVITCSYGLCVREENIGFLVPEAVLRGIAATYRRGASQPWRFRFKARQGFDWEDRIMPAEVAGLVLAVDRHGARIGHGSERGLN